MNKTQAQFTGSDSVEFVAGSVFGFRAWNLSVGWANEEPVALIGHWDHQWTGTEEIAECKVKWYDGSYEQTVDVSLDPINAIVTAIVDAWSKISESSDLAIASPIAPQPWIRVYRSDRGSTYSTKPAWTSLLDLDQALRGNTMPLSMMVSQCFGPLVYGLQTVVIEIFYPRQPTSHRPASPECVCGFYAYHTMPNGSDSYSKTRALTPVGAWGIIEGYGNVTLGTLGFRAEKARVRALLPRAVTAGVHGYFHDWKTVRRQLKKRFPDAAVVDSEAALLAIGKDLGVGLDVS